MPPAPTLPDCLAESLKMRVPRFTQEDTVGTKVARYEDYMMETAFVEGELTEERVQQLLRKAPLKHRWDHMQGWDHLVKGRTEGAVTRAKAQVNPLLYDELEEIDWLVKRLSEEIDRMQRDAAKCSRAYTMLTGS